VNPKGKEKLFDEWPETYDRWFTTPVGALVKHYESELILDFLKPGPGEVILDAGCGTGVFTFDILSAGSHVIGLDLSLPMLLRAKEKTSKRSFEIVSGNIVSLPFCDGAFDKVVSITSLEFIEDGRAAIDELFRVTKRGGCVVVATLNSLSPWATRRKEEAKKGHPLFQEAIFRSPDELLSLAPVNGVVRTAIHFQKDDDPRTASKIESEGRETGSRTGAFVAARWQKTS
jgi:ubiquinone/menaquinone biosynthesis C-methylase UbiE